MFGVGRRPFRGPLAVVVFFAAIPSVAKPLYIWFDTTFFATLSFEGTVEDALVAVWKGVLLALVNKSLAVIGKFQLGAW
jgi:hypothetical protein